jgi:predicted TIM-barrel fold metal-dependent hydrolase
MLILDAHAHLGHDVVFDEDSTEEELLAWHERYHVSGAIVQPFVPRPYLEDTAAVHDRIAALGRQYPGRFFGMASINPHLRPEDYDREAVRCVRELGFVGIKLTPIAHAAHPNSADGRHVFEVATALGVPIMVHTGAGIPFADPTALEAVAADFRKVPIILAHAGTDLFFAQALSLAWRFDHVYLEPSWLGILNLRKALKTVGVSKIMFSADHAVNIPVELAKYTTLLEPGPDLERALAGTTVEVFSLAHRLKEGKV